MKEREKWITQFAYQLGYLNSAQLKEISGSSFPVEEYLEGREVLSESQELNLSFLVTKYYVLQSAQKLGYLTPDQCRDLLTNKIKALKKGDSAFFESIDKGIISLYAMNKIIDDLYDNKNVSRPEITLLKSLVSSQSHKLSSSDEVALPDPQSQLLAEITGKTGSHTLEKVGPYRIIEEVGAGGMGRVYKAYHNQLDRVVAVKVMLDSSGRNSSERQRFLVEAKLTAKLNHPNIVRVFDVGTEGSIDYLVMDFIEGITLHEAMIERFSPRKGLSLIKKVALAMEHAHQKNIVHRDLKPGNILIRAKDQEPLVMDFGLAKNIKFAADITRTGSVMGTPVYMAPEQAEGKHRKINARTDVYALGAILYEMFTNMTPVTGKSAAQVMYNILHQDIVPPTRYNNRLAKEPEAICLKALEKDPRKRYQSAQELADDIDRFLNGEVIIARPLNPWSRMLRKVKKNKALSLAFASFLGIISLLVYFFLFQPAFVSIVPKVTMGGAKKPVGATIFFNGTKVSEGILNKIELSKGKYRVRITYPNYQDLEFILPVKAGQEISIEKELIPRKAALDVSSSVNEVRASLKNESSSEVRNFIVPTYGYSLETGEYQATFSKKNHFSEKRGVNVSSEEENSYEVELEPMLLWSKQVTHSGNLNSLHLVDFDRDGKTELVCSFRDGGIAGYELSSGSQVWSLPQNLTRHRFPVVVRDVNRDGFSDIVVGHYDRFMVMDGYSQKENFGVQNWWGRAFALSDVNGDKYEDVVLASSYHGLQYYDFQSKKMIWRTPSQKLGYISEPVFVSETGFVHSRPGEIYHMDVTKKQMTWSFPYSQREAAREIKQVKLNGRDALLWYVDGEGLFCLDLRTQNLFWKWPQTVSRHQSKKMVLGANERGEKTQVFLQLDRLYCLDIQNGRTIWETPLDDSYLASIPVLGDLDGDGQREIVVHTNMKTLVILDSQSGKEISRYQADSVIESKIIVDSDGDGRSEIIFASEDSLYCIQHLPDNKIQKLHGRKFLLNISPSIEDIDQDGSQEILATNQTGVLHCLDLNGSVNWKFPLPSRSVSSPLIIDIQGDAQKEIVLLERSTVFALNAQGEKLWQVPLSSTQNNSFPLASLDLDRDGKKEVLVATYNDGMLYCLEGKKGDIRWKKKVEGIYTTPFVQDIDRDSQEEILLTTSFGTSLYCLEAQTGKEKWKVALPSNSFSDSIVVEDVNGDGEVEIFVGQVTCYFSCLSSRGRILWQQKLPGTTFMARPLLDNFTGDERKEVVVCSGDGILYCLDSLTGRVQWSRKLVQDFYSAGIHFHSIQVSLDEDKYPDLMIMTPSSSFYILSGKDGSWLGTVNSFGSLRALPYIGDLNKDDLLDMILVDKEGSLVRILDFAKYFQRAISEDRHLSEAEEKKWIFLRDLQRERNFEKLFRQLQHNFDIPLEKKHFYLFYASLYQYVIGNWSACLRSVEKIEELAPRFYDAHFLKLLIYLQTRNENFSPWLNGLLKLSVMDFERCWQNYEHLLSGKTKMVLRKALQQAVAKLPVGKPLLNAYYHFSFMKDSSEKERFLKLFLKYNSSAHPAFSPLRQEFIEIVSTKYRQFNRYNLYKGIDLFEEALDILPMDPAFLQAREQIYQQTLTADSADGND